MKFSRFNMFNSILSIFLFLFVSFSISNCGLRVNSRKRKNYSRGIDLDKVDKSGWTPLCKSISADDLETVEKLLVNDANVNSNNGKGYLPLMIAIMEDHKLVFLKLLENGANPYKKNKSGKTSFDVATKFGTPWFKEILKDIKECSVYRDGILVPKVSRKNLEDKIIKMVNKGDLGAIILLNIADRMNITGDSFINNIFDSNGNSLLINAIKNSDKETLALELLRKGANVNVLSNTNMTPLMLAISKGYENILVDLLEKGAKQKFSDNGMQAKMRSIIDNATPKIKKLLNILKSNPNSVDYQGWPKIINMAASGNLPAIKLLLFKNANINAINPAGWSALMIALRNNNTEIAKFLINAGINLNIKSIRGNFTALSIAERMGNKDIIRLIKYITAMNKRQVLESKKSAKMRKARRESDEAQNNSVENGGKNILEKTIGDD